MSISVEEAKKCLEEFIKQKLIKPGGIGESCDCDKFISFESNDKRYTGFWVLKDSGFNMDKFPGMYQVYFHKGPCSYHFVEYINLSELKNEQLCLCL